MPVDPSTARARLADLSAALTTASRAVDSMDATTINHATRAMAEAHVRAVLALEALADALRSRARDLRCDDCRTLLDARGACPDCTPAVCR